jgi:hypothetical protein
MQRSASFSAMGMMFFLFHQATTSRGGRTFTGGADFFLKEIFSRASVFYEVNFGSQNYTNNIISTSLGFSF